ncbi:type-2 restriction enzyme BglI [Bacillus atrophaeus subsp. globigii]|uniref:Type II restriction enzyme BglI n=3 Tax=Bacillus subtilis group TaxID=653685 RepID=T2B1_BACIU|nr:BglI family type II restriction endonuclease [Bacillus atrophaeus]O68557.1 RecName: Full=Type II restriction enzyme BglI; Short=R.BglI; AltName: Full=Endonuclease BglI; AltName: Full=Type-2 restriction enzyme BglI [Bacillus subtilis]1DMU_A Chain A, Bgli Restriction Endonuclease [Bacillus subtilis]AAC63973.1 BglI restriction endonuclease [Bacillus subtilis subsp. globigii]ADP34551.1 putative Type II site-specific deoxyribonuclease (Type II restriction enzyme) [Bacillus atrophaeus 1942]AIK466
MYNLHREKIFMSYNQNKQYLEDNPEIQEKIELYGLNLLNEVISDNEEEIRADYNEANFLHPFWMNYPPLDRGKMPKGDQIPWIEVGEKAVGSKLTRLVSQREDITVREIGLPTGPDERYLLTSPTIYSLTNGFTDSIMMFVDIKSVGPRDSDYDLVLSPNQVSGNGDWAQLEGGIQNNQQTIQGPRSSQIFLPTIPPLYILSDGTIAPVVHLFIKPIYAMRSLTKGDTGQSLYKIKLASVPNGLGLFCNPGYAFDSAYKFLFRPGKDDRTKSLLQKRVRVDLRVLDKIGPRVMTIDMDK